MSGGVGVGVEGAAGEGVMKGVERAERKGAP